MKVKLLSVGKPSVQSVFKSFNDEIQIQKSICNMTGLKEKSDTTERLHFHFSLSCIGEGNGNPLQCSCLENPRDGGASWAAVYGVAQSRTRLKRLSSSSAVGLGASLWDMRKERGKGGEQAAARTDFSSWAASLRVEIPLAR